MKISSKLHSILDYLTVLFVAFSPMIFKMDDDLATFTYIVAGTGFLLTIFTRFEGGLIKLIPFPLHGLLEIVMALGLIGAAFWFNSADNDFAFNYFLRLALLILVIFVLTDYGTRRNF